jgi:tetratricopeptide (TPR) repeat protein
MANTFHTQSDFNANFGKEMISATSVYEQRQKSGMKDNSLAVYDFIFISDTEQKLRSLGDFLSSNYNYQIKQVTQHDGYYEITGDSTNFPVNEENLLYWALDLYCKGYEFDCKLDGYGAMGDPEAQVFPDVDAGKYDEYFDLAMAAYDSRNLGMAFIHFSTAIKINPNDPNAWYSRAIVKDELHTWKSARRDYDKAIELAPDFTDAIVNRAANKDEAGEYNDAVKDYTTVIGLEPQNAMAYFNRGNSKFNLKDKRGACEDWHMAKDLGAGYAQERIDHNCNNIFKAKILGLFNKN